MNAEDNYTWIDSHSRIHFVTTYSTYFAQDLATVDLKHFEPVDIEKNLELEACGQEEDRILAYRTKGEYWGKQRTVIVTFNPKTARKQTYTLEDKLERLRQELISMRGKVRSGAAQWRDPEVIKDRYQRLCQQLHISPQFYRITFDHSKDGLKMSFRKDPYQVRRKEALLGKNIIITDNMDWTTREIVEASLDRWQVERVFRDVKSLLESRPVYHQRDENIRGHVFCSFLALVLRKELERRLNKAGHIFEWSEIKEDLKALQLVTVEEEGKRFAFRSQCQGNCGKIFQAVKVALPPTIKEVA